jgi:hypothetical protein
MLKILHDICKLMVKSMSGFQAWMPLDAIPL